MKESGRQSTAGKEAESRATGEGNQPKERGREQSKRRSTITRTDSRTQHGTTRLQHDSPCHESDDDRETRRRTLKRRRQQQEAREGEENQKEREIRISRGTNFLHIFLLSANNKGDRMDNNHITFHLLSGQALASVSLSSPPKWTEESVRLQPQSIHRRQITAGKAGTYVHACRQGGRH